VQDIESLIKQVKSPYSREYFERMYNNLFSRARRTPIEMANSFSVIAEMLTKSALDIVDMDEKVRKELNIPELSAFIFPANEQTEEELTAIKEELKNKKLEAAKKLKIKPKTEEEEALE
jgi:hypothetical protein